MRVIGQYVSTDRNPSLYISPLSAASGVFGGSMLLAYKLNWQSVMFFGYGDDRDLTDQRQLARRDQQFLKASYAWQH